MNGNNSISDEILKAKVRRALLSGPDSITSEATVSEMDAQGKMTVLRPGTNQWVCVPGNENIIGQAHRMRIYMSVVHHGTGMSISRAIEVFGQ